jgi:Ni/Co efflux regulator RcnB
MLHKILKTQTLLALAVAAALGLAATPAFAGKPDWAGNGKGKSQQAKNSKDDKHEHNERVVWRSKHGSYFGEYDRDVVRSYYGDQFRKGKGCPPGLAKKHNGCMPPGQAKKWRYGHPLPNDVVWYPVPGELVLRLPAPPDGYRYVRVASDILMIAVGTSMVVDAIQDLGAI